MNDPIVVNALMELRARVQEDADVTHEHIMDLLDLIGSSTQHISHLADLTERLAGTVTEMVTAYGQEIRDLRAEITKIKRAMP